MLVVRGIQKHKEVDIIRFSENIDEWIREGIGIELSEVFW